MNSNHYINAELIKILQRVMQLTHNQSDFVWTRFDNYSEFKSSITQYIEKLDEGNLEVLWDIGMLFAPTGSFQELSICNGWAEEFITLADKVDNLIDSASK